MKVTFDQFPRAQRHLLAAVLGCGSVVFAGVSHPLMALPLLGGMLFCLFMRHSVVFNLDSRTYRAQHIFSTYEGTFADLKGIGLEKGPLIMPAAGQYQNVSPQETLYTVTLAWITPSATPYPLASMPNFDEALAYARDACERFSLPLIEGPKLKAYRQEVEQAHQDLAIL